MNIGQFALIKKDMRSVTSNKQVFTVLLIVPIVLTIALPSIFVFVISFAPDAASDFQKTTGYAACSQWGVQPATANF